MLFAQEFASACTDCGLCTSECLFFREFGLTPRQFAEGLGPRGDTDPLMRYSCNLCGRCTAVCPDGLDFRELVRRSRQADVERGEKLVPAQEWVQERQRWLEVAVAGVFPADPGERRSERAFFAGCSLGGLNPELVVKTRDRLAQLGPAPAVVLGCCGTPCDAVGLEAEREATIAALRGRLRRLGTKQLIVACPDCLHTLGPRLPEFEIASVYELLDARGMSATPQTPGHSFFLYHPCTAREAPAVKQAVRSLAERTGCNVRDADETLLGAGCCGMGGMVGLSNPVLALAEAQLRTENARAQVLTYCATCRDALAQFRPAAHLLDVLLSTDWQERTLDPALDEAQKRTNLLRLRSLLEHPLADAATAAD